MKKRKSVTETKNMVQTAVWLPRNLHACLKEAGGERGLGEEIRRQLQMAFEAGALNLAITRPESYSIKSKISLLTFRATHHGTPINLSSTCSRVP